MGDDNKNDSDKNNSDRNNSDRAETKKNSSQAHLAMSLRKCFEAKKAEMDAVPADQLKKLSLDCMDVVMTLSGVQPKVEPFRDQIAKELPTVNVRCIDELHVYVGALHHAHVRHGLLLQEDPPISEWADDLAEKHQLLLSTAEILAQTGILQSAVVQDLRPRASHKQLSLHTTKLTELLTLNWKAIENKTVLSPQTLEEIEADAVRLAHAIGERDQRLAAISASAETRLRAYTITLNAYSEVRRAMGFIRWYQGDADTFAPALANHAKRRSNGDATDATGTEPEEAVTKPASNDTSPTGAQPAVTNGATPAATGPNTAPFVR